jgi:hypothetical protein
MKNKILIFSLIILTCNALGQQINSPSIRKSDVQYCKVSSIVIQNEKTVVNFRYIASNEYINGGWVCAGDNFFIRDNETGRKYFLTKANNIPICPQKHNFKQKGELLNFSLEFQPIPNNCKEIDIIENLAGKGFNFFGVSLSNMDSYAKEDELQKDNAILYYITLSSVGKFRNVADIIGEILYTIPEGARVGVYSKEAGYYKVNYNGDIGYLSEVYFASPMNPEPKIYSEPTKSTATSHFPSLNPTDDEGKAIDSWLNAKIDKLIKVWGPPTKISSDGKGGQIYSYEETSTYQVAPGRAVTIQNDGKYVLPQFRNNTYYTAPVSRVITIYRLIFINEEGIIYYWDRRRREGN